MNWNVGTLRIVLGVIVAILGILMAVGSFPESALTVGLLFTAVGIALAVP